ncbi:thioredoxin family protein [Pseudolysinimonas sp.]|uniref:thioredoxin family protein n=1 Tax=Pseudolysinimonas sp. TaxID=2680009 RepID=UPI00286B61F5|nr:thioredoxin family protein [Pseudolysinimonas sp.]
MDRRLLPVAIGIVVAIVAAVIAVVVFAPPTAPGTAPPSPTSLVGDGTPTPESTAPPPSVGAYVEYSDDAIAQAEGRVLLFFHAPWCPQCRSIESDILAEGVPAGVTIIKIDYDSRQDLRQQYGVTLQTTFVEVDAAGTELQKHVAYDDPHLAAVVAAML